MEILRLSITNFYHQMYIQEISHQDVKKLLGKNPKE